MKKMISAVTITLLGISCLTACESNSSTHKPAAVQDVTAETGNEKSEASIDAGVHVDWDEVTSPLWNQDIETKLNATLHAIIEKDAKKLNEEVLPDSPGAFDYMLDDQYDFKKVSDVRGERENNRILVKVDHDVLMAESDSVQEGGYYYYFDKDEKGTWQLVAID